MTRFVALGLFAVLAYTAAMMYEPEQGGYSKADRDGMAKLVERSTRDSQPFVIASKRFEYPFACNDTDNSCLTLLAETPRHKGEPKLKRVIVQAQNGMPVIRWVHP